ncbi:MAG TPA: phosphoribosylglycinamide synthetase C domain-containing protein, partial [Acidimicrobiales bacterium]|nr:phosphoribosylglycinamide synthetase C domain-containing protein [Acidimicrobiales bacterium]
EFNVRFGDPDCQVVVPGLSGDVTALLVSAAAGALDASFVRPAHDVAVAVVVASDEPAGGVITGTDVAGSVPGVTVYHARTAEHAGALVTAGPGRVLSVTGRGRDIAEARTRAYAGAGKISFPGAYHRTDIAAHVKESEQ